MDSVQEAAQAKAIVESLSRELGLQETCRRAMDGISARFKKEGSIIK